MPGKYKTSKEFDRILTKLQKKDKQLYENLLSKMTEVLNNSDIEHYKNLRYDMKDFKRVHIGHFVLVFRFDKINDTIFFSDFGHHDNIYGKC
ncbi:type II toxin-antitoxin system mRNA interferase toxin, RelE/StbE family [Candidatus Woesearchaeota archaeon]|nr:type II toxin-antitoxin system mRNA interferase toxin, RelE/StbE family [Candidatus Woesearchaeota archaeon]